MATVESEPAGTYKVVRDGEVLSCGLTWDMVEYLIIEKKWKININN